MTNYSIGINEAMKILDSVEKINLNSQDRSVILKECDHITDIVTKVVKSGLIS